LSLSKELDKTRKAKLLTALAVHCFVGSPVAWKSKLNEKFLKGMKSICAEFMEDQQTMWSDQVFGRVEISVPINDTAEILKLVVGPSIFNSILSSAEMNHEMACANPLVSLRAISSLLTALNANTDKLHLVVLLGMWGVRQFYISSKKSTDIIAETSCETLCEKIISILKGSSGCIKLVDDTFLKSFVQSTLKYRFVNKISITLLSLIIADHIPSGMTAAQVLTMITGHSLYESVIVPIKSENDEDLPTFHESKSSLLGLMTAVISKDPVSCCTIDTLITISQNYYATLSESDTSALKIFRIYEEKAGISVAANITNWARGEMKAVSFQPGEALNMINSSRMASSIHWFPFDRDIEVMDSGLASGATQSSRMQPTYDPAFFLPLIGSLLKDYSKHIDPHRLLESNALGLAVMALSSSSLHTRKAAHFILAHAFEVIENSSAKERNQVMILLHFLRNAMPIEKEDEITPIPSLIASFVAQALIILLKPESDMYPVINQFLLQRPVLDLEDIPLFYQLFYSSTEDGRNERVWMLRLLKNGLNSARDYHIMQRRHAFEILFSFFASPLADRQTRRLVLEIIFKASTIPSVVSSLVTKSGLLAFFKSQIARVDPISELGVSLQVCFGRVKEGFQSTSTEWDGEVGRDEYLALFEGVSSCATEDSLDVDGLAPKRRKIEV
jgi:Nucleolar pre-ribosomal-associated protein 1